MKIDLTKLWIIGGMLMILGLFSLDRWTYQSGLTILLVGIGLR